MELSERVTLYDDGFYRWLYEVDMKKNPVIFLTVLKIVGLCLCIPLFLIVFLSVRSEGTFSSLLQDLLPFLISMAVILLITIGSYWYVSHLYGGKYCIVYEMDENGVRFSQVKQQFEKQQVIAKFATLTGALTGNVGLAGSGLYNMYNNSAYSDFKKVYSVKSYRDNDVIKVDSLFLFNQIYVNKEDFDLVDRFIREHCPRI